MAERKSRTPARDKNYVSFWFWFLAPLVLIVPCVGWVMIFYWALAGENESRKNFFRAMLVWAGIAVIIQFAVALAVGWPAIAETLRHLLDQWTEKPPAKV